LKLARESLVGTGRKAPKKKKRAKFMTRAKEESVASLTKPD